MEKVHCSSLHFFFLTKFTLDFITASTTTTKNIEIKDPKILSLIKFSFFVFLNWTYSSPGSYVHILKFELHQLEAHLTSCQSPISQPFALLRLWPVFALKLSAAAAATKKRLKTQPGSIHSDKVHDIYFMTAASLAASPCAAHTEGQICELVCSSLLCLPLIPAAPQPASLIHLHHRRRLLLCSLFFLRHSCLDHHLTPQISHERLFFYLSKGS